MQSSDTNGLGGMRSIHAIWRQIQPVSANINCAIYQMAHQTTQVSKLVKVIVPISSADGDHVNITMIVSGKNPDGFD